MTTDNTRFFGLNKGSAQVFDDSPLLNTYAQMLAKKQAQRQLELNQLAQQQQQLKPDGLRNDADRKEFFNQVNNWRNQAIAAQNERDPYKKAQLKAQADQQYLQAQALVNQSKQQAVRDNQFQQFAMNNATRHQLTDDAVQKGLANTQLGVNDPRLVNYDALQRAPDYEAFDKKTGEFYKSQLGATQKQYVFGKPMQDGTTPWTLRQQVDPQGLAHSILNEATFNPNYANSLQSKYPDLYANVKTEQDLHEAHAQAAFREANNQNLNVESGNGLYSPKETDNEKFAYHVRTRRFDINNPLPNQQGGEPGVPAPVSTIPYANGKASVNAKNFVPVSLPNKNFAGAEAIDLDAGKRVKALDPSDDYSIVGAGDYPVFKKGTNGAGNLVQPDGETKFANSIEHKRFLQVQQKGKFEGDQPKHYLIPYDKLPANIANQKDVRTALKNFNSTPVYNSGNQMIRVNLNGRMGQIPASKYNEFIKENPTAQKVE